jgi:hypothetical protein
VYSTLSPGSLLALVGVTIIVTRGTIFGWLQRGRWIGELFHCPLCFGFWCGAGGGAYLRGHLGAADVVLDGAVVALLSLLVAAVLERLLGAPETTP